MRNLINKAKIYSGVFLNEGFYSASVCPYCDNVFVIFESHIISGEPRFKYKCIQEKFSRITGKVGCICEECGEIVNFDCKYVDIEGKDLLIVGVHALVYFKSLSVWWNPWTWRTGYFIRKEDKDQIKKLTRMGNNDAV